MDASSRYWNIWQIDPANEKVRHKRCLVPIAYQFIEQNSINFQDGKGQALLLSYFHAKDNIIIAALSGLCLRCYVSEPILKACKKIDNLFGTQKQFIYQDLLPFVLNDDAVNLIIVDQNRKKQLFINEKGETKTTDYKYFSVEILRTFKENFRLGMSLDSWAYLQTKQNSELKKFLSEFGFKHLSDWALLNKTRVKQLELLSIRDRHLVEVFQAVYRRDRIRQHYKELGKCPDPSPEQLQEMLVNLSARNIIFKNAIKLIKDLKQVAIQLRQFDIWSYREPLEIQDYETGSYILRKDLPHQSTNELDVEEQEFLFFLHEQLKLALDSSIQKEIDTSINRLNKSKKYTSLAKRFVPGLQLYYCENKSLREIALLLGMTSWSQARRVLNPGELINKVRTFTVRQLVDKVLVKAQEKGLTKIPPEPDYLKSLAEQIEVFIDDEIFQEAAEEIRSGKNRSMNSLYAKHLCRYFKQHYQSDHMRS